MSWLIFSVICLFGWGFADLFYKKSSDENDSVSHLKIAVWVGMIMGSCAVCMLPFSETSFSFFSFFKNAVKYLPASLSYIISMIIGYAGMRYLEVSIVSPVQNASGALSAVFILIYFLVSGKINRLSDELSAFDIIGTVFVVCGLIFLGIVEQKNSDKTDCGNNKYRSGALALIFPLLYCVFDTVGTAFDGIILDDKQGLGLGEIDVLILYGITFFIAGIISWIIILVKTKSPYNPFRFKTEKSKAAAALCEEFGQIFYVYAMASRPVIAAPLVASYCIVSMILSRIFLNEKLKKNQYLCIFSVVTGIIILGISEGISEL